MSDDDQFRHLDGDIDLKKRETLLKLRTAVWAVPLVATFALSNVSIASAASCLNLGNQTFCSGRLPASHPPG